MRILFLCLILSIGGCSNDPAPTFNEGNRTVSCYVGNKPVAVVMRYDAKNLLELASARYNRILKRREILISNDIFNQDVAVVEFASYHECAHHQLNHVDLSDEPATGFFWSDKIMREEADVDCFAAETYIKNHSKVAGQKMFAKLKQSKLLDSKRLTRINNCLK